MKTSKSAALVLCAAAAVTTFIAPAASASPLSDFLDSVGLDFGSTGPTTGAEPGSVRVQFGNLSGRPYGTITASGVECLDVSELPQYFEASNSSLSVRVSPSAAPECGGRGTADFTVLTQGDSGTQVGGFRASVGRGGYINASCIGPAGPAGSTPLRCDVDPNTGAVRFG